MTGQLYSQGTSVLIPTVAAPTYIPTGSAQGSPFPTSSPTLICCRIDDNIDDNPRVHCSIIRRSQDVETTYVSFDGDWIKKMWYTSTVEYYSAVKKMKQCHLRRMGRESALLSETRQAEKDKNHMMSLMCGI